MKVPCKSSRAGGAPPRTDTLIGPAACGRCPKNGQLKTTRECARSLSLEHGLNISWSSLVTLPRSPTPEGRPAGISPQDRLRQITHAWIKDCVNAVTSQNQQRNDATISTQNQHQTISEISTPRWRHATAKRASRVFQSNTWKPTWKPNQSIQPASTTKASIISISDWTGKYDLNAVTKHTYLFVIFAGWLSYETGNNVIISTLTSKLPYVCVYVCAFIR